MMQDKAKGKAKGKATAAKAKGKEGQQGKSNKPQKQKASTCQMQIVASMQDGINTAKAWICPPAQRRSSARASGPQGNVDERSRVTVIQRSKAKIERLEVCL